jgi:hypothetical protein
MPCLLVLRVLLGGPCLVVQWQWLGRAAGGAAQAARAGCGCVLQRSAVGVEVVTQEVQAMQGGGTAVQQPVACGGASDGSGLAGVCPGPSAGSCMPCGGASEVEGAVCPYSSDAKRKTSGASQDDG